MLGHDKRQNLECRFLPKYSLKKIEMRWQLEES